MSEANNLYILDCFKNFRCTASKCSDNCCIGWEIDIDRDTAEFYASVKGEIGKRLSENIIRDGGCARFSMDENDRCPFLNKNNLCDIIITLGEDKLPYICKNHPRFYTWLEDRTECGIGICCEEGARELFASPEKLNVSIPYTLSEKPSDMLSYARETAFLILQEREHKLADRLVRFLDFCEAVDNCLLNEDIVGIKAVSDEYRAMDFDVPETHGFVGISELVNIFSELEPINDEWKAHIADIAKNEAAINTQVKKLSKQFYGMFYEYEHLAVYLTYRYFLKCLEDYELISKAKFVVLGVLFNFISDINSYLKTGERNRLLNSVMFSKEVEYSEANVERIYDMSYCEDLDIRALVKNFDV